MRASFTENTSTPQNCPSLAMKCLKAVNSAIGIAKFMPTDIWGPSGFHVLDLMPSQCRFNLQYLVEHVIMPLVQTVFPWWRTRPPLQFNLHLDNCRVHFSKPTEQSLTENQSIKFSRRRKLDTWKRGTAKQYPEHAEGSQIVIRIMMEDGL
jgi:hypothetical protein